MLVPYKKNLSLNIGKNGTNAYHDDYIIQEDFWQKREWRITYFEVYIIVFITYYESFGLDYSCFHQLLQYMVGLLFGPRVHHVLEITSGMMRKEVHLQILKRLLANY
jgi:hypothetical protein